MSAATTAPAVTHRCGACGETARFRVHAHGNDCGACGHAYRHAGPPERVCPDCGGEAIRGHTGRTERDGFGQVTHIELTPARCACCRGRGSVTSE